MHLLITKYVLKRRVVHSFCNVNTCTEHLSDIKTLIKQAELGTSFIKVVRRFQVLYLAHLPLDGLAWLGCQLKDGTARPHFS
jgi:hypothetical protein